MSKGRKKNVRVSSSVNQRLKAARENAAQLEAERAASKGEDVEDDDSAPLSGDQEAVDDHSGDGSSDMEDVTESDSANDEDSPHVEDTWDEYSGDQDATDAGISHASDDESEEGGSPLPVAADVVGDAFDDTDELHEDEFDEGESGEDEDEFGEDEDEFGEDEDEFGEDEDEFDEDEDEFDEDEFDDSVLPKSSPVRRSAALPDGYPLVEWEVLDVLGADDDWLPRWNILANPPTLVLRETETGQQVEMKLTRKVARDLDYSIHGIMSIYEEGVAYPEPRKNPIEWAKSGWRSYWEWVREHKVLGFVTSVLSAAMLLVLVTSLVGTSLVSLFGGGLLGGKVAL